MAAGSYDPLAVLASFGLSGYQARVYLALLELGPSQAREVSERSGVPQGRVYDVLEKLHQRGLAEVLPEAPRRYRAVPFESFLDRELDMHRDRVGTLERERESLLLAMASVQGQAAGAPERGEFVVLRGRKAILERVAATTGEAQRDLLILGTEPSASRLATEGELLAHLADRSVRVRLLVPVTKGNAEAVQTLGRRGVEVRHQRSLLEAFPPGLNLVLADGARAMLYQHIPDNLDMLRGDDTGLHIDHPEMVRGVQALGESLWLFGLPAGERLHEITAGTAPDQGRPQAVLLVDDERDILDSLREVLEGSLPGVRFHTAEAGDAALEILRKAPVDLIVADYKLPGMNGLELLEQASKVAPGVPRILITAFPDLKVALRAINEAGVEHFITKPFQSRQVTNIVRAVLAERREQALREQALSRAMDATTAGAMPPAG